MTTLHLLPSSGHQTAASLKQNALAMLDEAQLLRRAIQNLSMSWQGGGQEEFSAQAGALLRKLESQVETLQVLAERLEREVTEWEETDRRGAAAFRGSGRGALFLGYAPFTAGPGESAFFSRPVLPVFTALSVVSFLSGLPAWMNSLLERFFPPPAIVSPIPDEAENVQPGALKRLFDQKFPAQPSTTFGDLLNKTAPAAPSMLPQGDASQSGLEGSVQVEPPPPSASPSAQVAPAPKYEVYYDIPPKSQGTLYGSAACLPTSVSMALDHFHAQNSANRTASPDDLIGMLDPGDGTLGKGVGLDKLNDDLGELGYNAAVRTGSMDDLRAALNDGPVVVNVKVGLVSAPARDITPDGSYNHSILVKGINADSVVINEPWSGAEKILPRDTFAQIWKGGGNYMVIVRPQGSAQ